MKECDKELLKFLGYRHGKPFDNNPDAFMLALMFNTIARSGIDENNISVSGFDGIGDSPACFLKQFIKEARSALKSGNAAFFRDFSIAIERLLEKSQCVDPQKTFLELHYKYPMHVNGVLVSQNIKTFNEMFIHYLRVQRSRPLGRGFKGAFQA